MGDGGNAIGYDEVLGLVFANPAAERVVASIDGKPCEVGCFYYPGHPMFVYDIELIGILSSGSITHLRLEITWAKEDTASGKKQTELTPKPTHSFWDSNDCDEMIGLYDLS